MEPGVVVGVPGANTFNSAWSEYFYRREIITMYDHDEAGIQGETRVYSNLQNVAASIKYIHWPLEKESGWDVRDQVIKTAIKKKNPQLCYRILMKWMEDVPREFSSAASVNSEGNLVIAEARKKNEAPVEFAEVISKFKELLYIEDITPIRVMLSVIVANRLRSDMLWLFIVAPPSSAKTEYLQSLFLSEEIVHLGSLTDKTLVSGFNQGGVDPSLLPKLNNKVLVIKDFTSILTTNPIQRETIFGQLREAYDKKIHRGFGNNVTREYTGIHFGLLAGVTPKIESQGLVHANLGERFLRYYLPIPPDDLSKNNEKHIMTTLDMSIDQVAHEKEKRRAIQEAVANFLRHHKMDNIVCSEEYRMKIKYLSRFIAKMRGIVDRDFNDVILYRPSHERPNRVVKQLYTLGIGLASLDKRKEVNMDDYRILCQIADTSCPDRVRHIVRIMHEIDRPLSIKEIATKTRMGEKDIRVITRDLILLNIIEQSTGSRIPYYTISGVCKHLIKESKVYELTDFRSSCKSTVNDTTTKKTVKKRKYSFGNSREMIAKIGAKKRRQLIKVH